jgi:hypothetical protein
MAEDDLHIARDGPALLLPLGQQKDSTSFLLGVETISWIGEHLLCVKSLAQIHVKEGVASATREVWHVKKLDSLEAFEAGRLDLMTIKGFKVVEVPQLTWLTHSFATSEPLMSIEPEAVIHIIEIS